MSDKAPWQMTPPEFAAALEIANEALGKALDCIVELRRQLGAERRYIEALEGQLEPSVIEEIKDELSAQKSEEEDG
jgi:hypothetical protein